MLKIENLSVAIDDREILKDINMEIKKGEVHALFGANGSGKSTLLSAIMGYPQFKVTNGRIIFKDTDITEAEIDERARLGLGFLVQRPPAVKGVTLREAVAMSAAAHKVDFQPDEYAEELNVGYLMERDLNLGFSGGEAKRSELLQLAAQQPDLLMFDEPESGVDLVNMELVGNTINELLGKHDVNKGPRKASGLVITHTGFVLDYVNADVGHVLCDGVLTCTNNPLDMLEHIRLYGYEQCAICPTPGQ